MAPKVAHPNFFTFVSPHSRRFREIVLIASVLILVIIWFDYTHNYAERNTKNIVRIGQQQQVELFNTYKYIYSKLKARDSGLHGVRENSRLESQEVGTKRDQGQFDLAFKLAQDDDENDSAKEVGNDILVDQLKKQLDKFEDHKGPQDCICPTSEVNIKNDGDLLKNKYYDDNVTKPSLSVATANQNGHRLSVFCLITTKLSFDQFNEFIKPTWVQKCQHYEINRFIAGQSLSDDKKYFKKIVNSPLEWLVISDCQNYPVMENLEMFLLKFNSTQSLGFRITRRVYILNKVAVKQMVDHFDSPHCDTKESLDDCLTGSGIIKIWSLNSSVYEPISLGGTVNQPIDVGRRPLLITNVLPYQIPTIEFLLYYMNPKNNLESMDRVPSSEEELKIWSWNFYKMLRHLKFMKKSLLDGFSKRPISWYGYGIRTLFINPSPDHIPTITTSGIVNEIRTIYGIPREFQLSTRSEQKSTPIPTSKLSSRAVSKGRQELVARRMQDSFVTALIPLSQNWELRERYVTFYGTVRIGRLLEDLDIFAAWSCYKHTGHVVEEGRQPFNLVTALVDRVNFSSESMKADEDIRLSAHVSWVGNSSIEVAVLVDQKSVKGEWKQLTSAKFVFVARDPLNHGSVTMNPLVGETDAEKAFIERGAERSRQRKLTAQESLDLKPPTEEERELIHKMFVSNLDSSYCGFRPSNSQLLTQPSNSNIRLMEDSRLNTLVLCHPQHRNIFGKIFGGLIMRKAFELAFSNTYLYTKTRPSLISIDDIIFRKPIEIGAILRFGSEIAYVEDNYVHTPVMAEVLNPETGERHVTNIFHFTFLSGSESPMPNLLPKTYQEAMIYLNARRHFKHMKQCYLTNTLK